jgi:hypothetical protein
MQKPFSAAVDMFCQLGDTMDTMVMDALKLTEQQKLTYNACPACFGLEPPNLHKYPVGTKNQLIVCLDGSFQHRQHSKASCEETIHAPHIFINQSEVKSMTVDIRMAEIQEKPPAQVLWLEKFCEISSSRIDG